jgi:predicted ATP-binding protein involved in virulence
VLYCGSGVSAQAGFPYWQPFVEELTEWTIRNGFVTRELGASLKAALAQGQYDSVSDNLVSIMRDRQAQLNKYLSDIFLKKATLPDSVKLLKDLPFAAAMTTNFDNLLEQAFGDKSTSSLTPADAELLLQCLHKREFFLLKLYGKLEQPDTVMLAPSQYDDFTRGNLVFSNFMETLLISRTVFFVGSSLEGIQGYLKGIGLSRQKGRTHYALVAVTGEAWQAKANPLNDRYGIEVLPYSPSSEDHPEGLKFLQNLDAELKQKSEGVTERREPETVLKKISVTDIGPFDKLELKFDPHWNILLGDNGVGKSSIIKAIAIAILGEDSRSYAQRIIKAGKPNSTITLESGRATYTTRLFRKNGEARVESIPGRAFEAEGWLAVAFPPLRTVSWIRPTSAETGTTGRERPTTDDLLPVIAGEADPRLDKLKQWIVNVDYRIKDAKSRKEDPAKYERLLNDFFNVVRDLTEGTKIEFKEVNPATKEITVITNDGELPIEALSQGMTSLIGWVGILLQRLYEVYGKNDEDDDPKKRYALVLMDEIDAHLHPAWQQSLIRKLSNIFPNVQFIATTHSPLIVGGMEPQQIIRFARDEDDNVVTYTVSEEMTIGRADQILSSDLFGLGSTIKLHPKLQKLMDEYHDLLGNDERDEKEESRFREVREILKDRIPPVAETPAEQKAMRLVRALVQTDGEGELAEENKAIVDRAAKALLDEVDKRRK